jgi:hypothetical protein
VRGVPVLREGEVVGQPGHGRFVRPLPAGVWSPASA